MSRPIAGINKYPFGVCGFLVDGAVLRDGTRLKNLRIYKQRSDVMFDLIDPTTEIVYQKLLLTGYYPNGLVLPYDLTNDQVLAAISPNTFFVRGYNDSMTRTGYIVKFLYNKVILSSSRPIFDVHTPECHIPLPVIQNVILAPVKVGDDSITGVISTPGLDTTGMVVTITLPDGTVLTTTVTEDGAFEISPVTITQTGIATIKITSDLYEEYNGTFTVLADDEDSDYVTSVTVTPVLENDMYVAHVSATEHLRGEHLVVQAQQNGVVIGVDINVDPSGEITTSSSISGSYELVIIGSTLDTTPYFGATLFVDNPDEGYYEFVIPFSEHEKPNPMVAVYDSTDNMIGVEIIVNDAFDITLRANEVLSGSKFVVVGK